MSENKKRKVDDGYHVNEGYTIVPGQSEATLLSNYCERPDKVQKANASSEDITYDHFQQEQLQQQYIQQQYLQRQQYLQQQQEYLQQQQQQEYLQQQQQQNLQQRQHIQSDIWNQAETLIKNRGLQGYAYQ